MAEREFKIQQTDYGYLADSMYITGIEEINSYIANWMYVATFTFKYSDDAGETFSEYIPITELSSLETDPKKIYKFLIKFEGEGILFDFALDYDVADLKYPTFDNSFFSKFFDINDKDVLEWSVNVFHKLRNDIVADYVSRENDFSPIWNTVTHLYAILITYFRKFEDIRSDNFLLERFLESIGIYIHENATLTELQYIFDNYIEEFENRGSERIHDEKEGSKIVDGEARRLVNYSEPNEYISALIEPWNTGWCVGNSSPSVNYTTNCFNLIKGYESTQEPQFVINYPRTNDVDLYDEENPYGEENSCIRIRNFENDAKGIAPIDTSKNAYTIPIDTNYDYEITCFLKLTDLSTNIDFGVRCYDANKDLIDNSTKNFTTTGGNSSYFFQDSNISGKAGEWNFLRGIIKNEDATATSDTRGIDWLDGNHLQFNPSLGIKYIIPILTFDGVASQTVFLYDFKIRPSKFNFTQGILGIKNILWMLLKNNSNQRDDDSILKILSEELISYRSNLILNII